MAILDDYEQVALSMADWAGALPGVELTVFGAHLGGPDAVAAALEPFDIVMAMRERTAFGADLLRRLPNLRLLVTTGMRNRSIDLAAATDAGIVVCGTDGLPWATPELAWGLILAVARQIPRADASMRAGEWAPHAGMELNGATLGLVGLGRLGGQVATVARAFGMELVAWSPHLTEERAAAHGARLVTKGELFRTADVVSVHMVLAESTRGLIGEAELRAMKPTALFVNTSRGPLVVTEALVLALTEGWIAGAGIDVYDQEPLPADDPLRTVPRAVLTPHQGYVTTRTFELFYRQAVEDVQAYLAGTPVRVLSR